ncbi:hypothetical protein QCA50_004987 [Cerrena zonata]|uniref:DUF6534 domain-containing protein n=1 Tax=Cerrena zonata TaxID=2478898 RepID=A0AAW0GDS0_9APHY
MSTGALIAFLSSPSSFGYQAFDFMLSKTYANAMMASLNARQSLRSIGQASGANVLSTTQPLSGGIFVGRDTDTSGDGNTTNVALGNLMLSQDDRKTATSSTSKIEVSSLKPFTQIIPLIAKLQGRDRRDVKSSLPPWL